jgi:hypothetical protein
MNMMNRDVFAFHLSLTYRSAETASAQSAKRARRASNVNV